MTDLVLPSGGSDGTRWCTAWKACTFAPKAKLKALLVSSSKLRRTRATRSHPVHVSSIDSLLATSTSASFRSRCLASRCLMHLFWTIQSNPTRDWLLLLSALHVRDQRTVRSAKLGKRLMKRYSSCLAVLVQKELMTRPTISTISTGRCHNAEYTTNRLAVARFVDEVSDSAISRRLTRRYGSSLTARSSGLVFITFGNSVRMRISSPATLNEILTRTRRG